MNSRHSQLTRFDVYSTLKSLSVHIMFVLSASHGWHNASHYPTMRLRTKGEVSTINDECDRVDESKQF